jgi:hypothetical protein
MVQMCLNSNENKVHINRLMHYIYRPASHVLQETTERRDEHYIRQYILSFSLLKQLRLNSI